MPKRFNGWKPWGICMSGLQAERQQDINRLMESLKLDKLTIARLKLKNRTIQSQIDGTVVQVFHTPGEFVNSGEPIARIIDFGFQQEDNKWFSAQSLEIGISQGANAAVGNVALLLSRDNVQYGPPIYKDLGDFANYQNKLIWNEPGGLGSYDGFFGVRLYTTSDVIFNSEWLAITFRS